MAWQAHQTHCALKNKGHPHLQGGTPIKTHTQRVKLLFATLLFSTLVLVFPNAFAINSFEEGVNTFDDIQSDKKKNPGFEKKTKPQNQGPLT